MADKKGFFDKKIWYSNCRQSEQLLPAINKLLEKNRFFLKMIKGLVVISGPGSYTGLRVGISCGNALSFALKIPVVGINRLEILAEMGVEYWQLNSLDQSQEINICSIVPTARDLVFAGFYIFKNGKIKQKRFFTGTIEKICKNVKIKTYFIGEIESRQLEKVKAIIPYKVIKIKQANICDEDGLEILCQLGLKGVKKVKLGNLIFPLYINEPYITNITKEK